MWFIKLFFHGDHAVEIFQKIFSFGLKYKYNKIGLVVEVAWIFEDFLSFEGFLTPILLSPENILVF